jgi:hypothetical protein
MSSTALRNIGIVLLLAVAVFAIPGGGTAAGIVSALLSIAFGVLIWLFLMRMYREHKLTIYGLGDKYRGVLYASLAGLLFAGTAGGRGQWFDSPGLVLLWFAVLGAAIYGLVATWRHWREYS